MRAGSGEGRGGRDASLWIDLGPRRKKNQRTRRVVERTRKKSDHPVGRLRYWNMDDVLLRCGDTVSL